jgi:predicted helicase
MTTIHDILEEFREDATSNRDLGDKFEQLIVAYLKTDPMYKDRFSNIWMWMEWPKRGNRPDTGIDLVAEEEATGDIWAIQCKFYDPHHTLEKQDIDSFFTVSGKSPFTKRMIVSTTDYKVCDRSALEWIMERYQINKDKASSIVNDPNDWSDDPRYIVDLVKRIVRVSLETVRIVNSLPVLNEKNNDNA